MKPAVVLIVVILAAAFGCLALVLNDEYASGNVYSEYSSRRTDRMGSAALYEALGRVFPNVTRNELPLRGLTVKDADILILGLSPMSLALDPAYLDTLQALASQGNRVVVALDGDGYVYDLQKLNQALDAKWQVRVADSRNPKIRSRQSLEFEAGKNSGWKVVGANPENTVAVMRDFEKGSLLLRGSSWPFTNGSLSEDRDLAAIQLAIGKPSRIVFDETHLGTVESGTVMGLARRFRLQGVIGVALACALLFIWQSSAPFPPERARSQDESEESGVRIVAPSAGEGLRNLLGHHIPPGRLLSVCVAEWRRDRGRLIAPDTLARIESIAARRQQPSAQWREIRAVLKPNPK